MLFNNFSRGNYNLNGQGYMMCDLDNSGGFNFSPLTSKSFNTVSVHNGTKRIKVGYKYEETYTCTFDICKKDCTNNDFVITKEEFIRLAAWLASPIFENIIFYGTSETSLSSIYFNGTFEIEQITRGQDIVGARLTLITDAPFGWIPQGAVLSSSRGWDYNITDPVEKLGSEPMYIYPEVQFDLSRRSASESFGLVFRTQYGGRAALVDVVGGNIYTLNCEKRLIYSSDDSDMYENFNFVFPYYDPTKTNTSSVSIVVSGSDLSDIIVRISYRALYKLNLL